MFNMAMVSQRNMVNCIALHIAQDQLLFLEEGDSNYVVFVSKVDGSDFPWCTSDAAATVCKSFDPVAGAGYPSL